MTLQEAKSIARHLGLTLRKERSGHYCVKLREGNENPAYYSENLEDVVNAAVVSRDLVSIAELHAVVSGTHLAQSESEMACNRFGFLECHGLPSFRTRMHGVASDSFGIDPD